MTNDIIRIINFNYLAKTYVAKEYKINRHNETFEKPSNTWTQN